MLTHVAEWRGRWTGRRNWHASVRRFFSDPKATCAGAILGIIVLVALFAPVIAPYGEAQQDPTASLAAPSREHLLGTDRLGRDVLSRMIYGSRVSLQVATASVAVAMAVGVPIGLIAGYNRGWMDELLMRCVDVMIAFPNLLFILVIVAMLGPGLPTVMIAIGINSFPIYARLIRGQTLALRGQEFVLAAHSVGAGAIRTLFSHILPNAVQPVIVQAALTTGAAVLTEASLSFLGLGVEPPTATWGAVIQNGFPYIREAPVISIAGGVGIVLFVLAVNLMGDRLRDVLDPRLRGA